MPTLPIKLESLESAAARFPAAIARAWDVGTVTEDLPVGDRPGKHRENVFDVEDGNDAFRLIISLDRQDSLFRLHISVSIIHSVDKLLPASRRIRQLKGIIERIVGKTLPAPIGEHVTRGRVLHLFWEAAPIGLEVS